MTKLFVCIAPSEQPTQQPTIQPSEQPTQQPIQQPSLIPTQPPCLELSVSHFRAKFQYVSERKFEPRSKTLVCIEPSHHPTEQPSIQPTEQPSEQPTQQPSSFPTQPPCLELSDLVKSISSENDMLEANRKSTIGSNFRT